MARFVQKTCVIHAGQSLSDVIDCVTGAPVFLYVPVGWSPARVSFQASPDGTNFYNLFDSNAREMQYNVRAGSCVLLDATWTPVQFLKVRSGSCDLAVPQEADRQIIITIDTSAA